MTEIKTDGDIVRIARMMEGYRQKLVDALSTIRLSDHPNAEQIADALDEQCVFFAWPEHIIKHHLEHPERWETGDYGIRHKRGSTNRT